jgi:hypothetical protein
MKRRTEGKLAGDGKSCPWKGLELCDRDNFIEWSLTDENFNRIFKAWHEAGNPRALSPSVDRVDTTKGYTLDNIQWVTNHFNSMKALYGQV